MEFCILRHPSSVLIQKYRSELCKSGGALPPTMKLGGQLSPLPPFSYPLHISCTLPLTTVSHFTFVVGQQNPHAIVFKILPYNIIIVHTAIEIHPPSLSLSAVADPGFEEGGFQVCGRSPHGCRRQLPRKRPMLGGVWGHAPPENIFCKMDALRRVFLHSGAILGTYIAERKILVSLL